MIAFSDAELCLIDEYEIANRLDLTLREMDRKVMKGLSDFCRSRIAGLPGSDWIVVEDKDQSIYFRRTAWGDDPDDHRGWAHFWISVPECTDHTLWVAHLLGLFPENPFACELELKDCVRIKDASRDEIERAITSKLDGIGEWSRFEVQKPGRKRLSFRRRIRLETAELHQALADGDIDVAFRPVEEALNDVAAVADPLDRVLATLK